MIKNVIFDLGNVLISFRPAVFLDKMGYPENVKNIILRDIFKSKEWQLIDSGYLSTGEAIDSIASWSTLKRQEIIDIFDLRPDILYPLDENIKLLPSLKKHGFKLYFLSNFPSDIFDDIFKAYPFFNLFDGGIISARVKASKPDKKIFEILLNKYSILPKECLFIDDLEPNVKTAESIGMTGIWLYDSVGLDELIEKKLNQVSLR
jgi:HAD superfamily hydrolase (TIGR01509 family)